MARRGCLEMMASATFRAIALLALLPKDFSASPNSGVKAPNMSSKNLYFLVGNLPSSKQAIEQCRKGEGWRLEEFVTKKYKFLDDMFGSFTPEFGLAEKSLGRKTRSAIIRKLA